MLAKIENTTRSFINLFRNQNALATLNDINQVVDDINFMRNFTDVRILVTQTGTTNPSFRMLSSGISATKCYGDCNVNNGDDCCSDKIKRNNDYSITFLRTGVGVYTLDIRSKSNITYPEGLMGTTFLIGPPSTLGNRVTVVFNPLITDPDRLQYTVRTYNDAGVLSDDRLSNLLFNLCIYGKPPRSRQVNLSLTVRF